MTSKLTSEILDDETLAELIAFRRSRVEYCQKEGLPYQKALHDSMMLALEELQERRKPLQDKDLQGVIDALEHPAGINAAGKQVVRHALVEIQERRKAERDSNPVGWTDEAELRDVEKDGCGYLFKANPITLHADPRRVILLYRHAQPAPVVPEEKPIPNTLSMYAVDAVAAIAEVKGWNACRAAMLQAKSLTSINPAPALVSLPKNAKSLTGNSPVIGIGLASGPDRTVEVHYVVLPGYVVVPKEPTDEMIAAAMNCEDVLFNSDDSFCVQFVNIYEAMLAAAPKEVK
ncbi:hypothetical protein [Klebsiella pneumoniae]